MARTRESDLQKQITKIKKQIDASNKGQQSLGANKSNDPRYNKKFIDEKTKLTQSLDKYEQQLYKTNPSLKPKIQGPDRRDINQPPPAVGDEGPSGDGSGTVPGVTPPSVDPGGTSVNTGGGGTGLTGLELPTQVDLDAIFQAFKNPGSDNVQQMFDMFKSGQQSQSAYDNSAARLRERTGSFAREGEQQAMQQGLGRGVGSAGFTRANAVRARNQAGEQYAQGLTSLEMDRNNQRMQELGQASGLAQSQQQFGLGAGGSALDFLSGRGQRSLGWGQELMGDKLARDLEQIRQSNENNRLNKTLQANKNPGTNISVSVPGIRN